VLAVTPTLWSLPIHSPAIVETPLNRPGWQGVIEIAAFVLSGGVYIRKAVLLFYCSAAEFHGSATRGLFEPNRDTIVAICFAIAAGAVKVVSSLVRHLILFSTFNNSYSLRGYEYGDC
jgi:hypothetical protein